MLIRVARRNDSSGYAGLGVLPHPRLMLMIDGGNLAIMLDGAATDGLICHRGPTPPGQPEGWTPSATRAAQRGELVP